MKAFSLSMNSLKSISFSRVAELLFCAGVFTLPFQIYTIIWQPEIHLSGQSNEFTNAYIYLGDLLFMASAVFFLFSREKFKLGDKVKLTMFAALMAVVILTNTVFPETWLVFRLIMLAVVYLLIVNKVTSNNRIFKTLLLSVAMQSIIAAVQYITQGSIGLDFLGEPNLASAGIAKIDMSMHKQVIRSYGTMQHPNILGGFLAIAIILSGGFRKWKPLIITCFAGLIFTMSRSALLGLFVAGILFKLMNIKSVFRFVKNHAITVGATIAAILILGVFYHVAAPFATHLQSSYEIEQRLMLVNPSLDIIYENPMGIGWQNFTNVIQDHLDEKLMPWEYQPIHNVYILATAELGMIGAIIMLFLLLYSILSSKNKKSLYALIALSVIGVFDHYWYSFYAPQVLAIILVATAHHPSLEPAKSE